MVGIGGPAEILGWCRSDRAWGQVRWWVCVTAGCPRFEGTEVGFVLDVGGEGSVGSPL